MLHVHKLLTFLISVKFQYSLSHICDGYETWIFVSSAESRTASPSSSNSQIQNYTSLASALLTTNLNNSCIVIQDNTDLTEDIRRQNVNNILISSLTENRMVTCSTRVATGISFHSSTNIIISNLNFKHCGGKDRIQRTCDVRQCSSISSALYIENCNNISIHNVHLINSFGYGLTVVDSNHIILNLMNVEYSNNFEMIVDINRTLVPGGGLYVEYSPSYNAKKHTIQLRNCNFVRNNASKYIQSKLNDTLPFGKGGAITVFYMGNAMENNLTCSGGIIANNEALEGGGVYIHFSKKAKRNSVTFNEMVNVMYNKAVKKGGGFNILHKVLSNKNNIFLNSVSFQNNQAYIGGCISIIVDNRNSFLSHIYKDKPWEKIFCRDCYFVACRGKIGSSIYLKGTRMQCNNLNLRESQRLDYYARKGYGAVYALNSAIFLVGNSTISYNNGTSFILDSSTLTISDKVLFSNNYGYNGGALSLYGHSQIILTKMAQLRLIHNRATNKGGAIYSTKFDEDSKTWIISQSPTFAMFRCFIGFYESYENFSGSVVFENNTVKTGFGSDIFSSTLQYCRLPKDSSINQTIGEWKNFNFSNKNRNNIVTGAVRMEFSNTKPWENMYPGKLITPDIKLFDERGNQVQGAAKITFTNGVSMEQDVALIVGKNMRVKFRLLGPENTRYNVTASTISTTYLKNTLNNLYLNPCPFGMKNTQGQKCQCNYEENRAHGIAECNGPEIFLYHDRWVPPIDSHLKLKGYSCPLGYCKPCNTTNSMSIFCNYEKNYPCTTSRSQSSRLCGRCERGKSVTIGGFNDCKDCRNSHGWIFVSLGIVVGVSVFVVLLGLFGIDIMTCHLGSVIYFYQVLYHHYSSQMWSNKDKFPSVLSLLTGWIEFSYLTSGFPDSCMFDGMNDLHKVFYDNIIPITMLLAWGILYCCSSDSDNRYLSKSKLLHAFTIVGLMIYTDLTKNSLTILDYMVIDNVTYPFIYADSEYAGGEHLLWFILSVIIILVFTVCIPIYFFIFAVRRMQKTDLQQRNNATLESMLSFFIKSDRYWFLPYFFISRISVILMGILIPNSPSQTSAVTMVSLIIFVVFTAASPYVSSTANNVESILLAILVVIGILNLGLQAVYQQEYIYIFRIIVKALSTVPVCVLVLKIFWKVIGNRCVKKERERDTYAPVPVPQCLQYNEEPV